MLFDWQDEYEELATKINDANKKSIDWNLSGDFAAFSNIERKSHPTIIKVKSLPILIRIISVLGAF